MRALATVTILVSSAHAQVHTSREVADAPLPGDESGRIDHESDGDSPLRVAARGVLYVPRAALALVTTPVRGLVWVEDRYKLGGNDEHAGPPKGIHVSPIASYETGFGASIGARVTDDDVASVQAAIGLGYRARANATVATTTGPVQLGLTGGYERIPDLPFYGIGNLSNAMESNYLLEQEHAAAFGDVRLAHSFHIRATATFEHTAIGETTDDDLVPLTMTIPGYGARDAIYPELELRFDDRGAASEWLPSGVHSAGSLIRVFGGRAVELAGTDFWHYGGELQHYWQIGHYNHVIGARLYGEGVTGSLADLPFYDLPALGGDSYLRGYTFDRFRDRIAAFGEVQYRWGLSSYADAYLFVSSGRVYRDLRSLTVDDLRLGYGIGLALLSGGGHFLADGMIGSSIDGGIVGALSFTPIEDRARRLR